MTDAAQMSAAAEAAEQLEVAEALSDLESFDTSNVATPQPMHVGN
jgi:hypothetical protein